MAIAMAVVTFGHKEHRRVMENFTAEHGEGVYVDLRELLSDPLGDDRVKFREDGSHAKTIIAVYGQPSLARAVTSTMCEALSRAERWGAALSSLEVATVASTAPTRGAGRSSTT